MRPETKPKVGQKFIAIVRKGEYSKTLEGKQGAGRRIVDYCGLPFLCHRVDTNSVCAMDMKAGLPFEWHFVPEMWDWVIVE